MSDALERVTRAAVRKANAVDEYRAAILAARAAGHGYKPIASAAGTSGPNIVRIVQRSASMTHGRRKRLAEPATVPADVLQGLIERNRKGD